MDTALASFAVLLAVLSYLPLVPNQHWIFRLWDFPRIQIGLFQLLVLILWPIFLDFKFDLYSLVFCTTIFTFLYNFNKVRHHTFIARKETASCEIIDDHHLSVISANVLQENNNFEEFVNIIKKQQPDIFLTMESNQQWEDHLNELETNYPNTVKCPLDNLYGMHLYSKLELKDTELRFLVQDDIPSIRTKVELPCGKLIELFCAHPEPPSPTESETSAERDFELMLIAREIVKSEFPVLTIGDFNDVTWSRNVKRFKKATKLKDPRIGRGFFSTYNAKYKLLRFPIDHIYLSDHFGLDYLKRMPYYGSDHFAMNYSLCLKK